MRKQKVSFGDIGMYGSDISDEMNQILDESWRQQYGLEITDVALADINLTDASMKRVSNIDDATIFSDKNLQSGLMAQATAEAMKNASSNEAGVMAGFMGMNMASNAGASVMGVVNQSIPNQQSAEPTTDTSNDAPQSRFCTNCGKKVTGKFCSQCGTKTGL